MVKILPVLLIQFSSFLFGQNAAQLESQRVAEQNYKIQVSNGAFEKAIDEMSSSARKSSQEKINQIDDDFEFNFSELIPNIKNKNRLFALPNGNYFLIPSEWMTRYSAMAKLAKIKNGNAST